MVLPKILVLRRMLDAQLARSLVGAARFTPRWLSAGARGAQQWEVHVSRARRIFGATAPANPSRRFADKTAASAAQAVRRMTAAH